MQDQRAWPEELSVSVESQHCYFSAFSAGAMMGMDLCSQRGPDTSAPWVTDSKRDQITPPLGRSLLRSTRRVSRDSPPWSDSSPRTTSYL